MTRGEVLTKEKKKPESIVLFVAVLDANSFSLDKKKSGALFFYKIMKRSIRISVLSRNEIRLSQATF